MRDEKIDIRNSATHKRFATTAKSRGGFPSAGGSQSWRSSHSPSPTRLRKFLANSIASCFEFAFRMAKPPTTSLASVKGPSVTVRLSPERQTRAPSEVGITALAREQEPGPHTLFGQLRPDSHFLRR